MRCKKTIRIASFLFVSLVTLTITGCNDVRSNEDNKVIIAVYATADNPMGLSMNLSGSERKTELVRFDDTDNPVVVKNFEKEIYPVYSSADDELYFVDGKKLYAVNQGNGQISEKSLLKSDAKQIDFIDENYIFITFYDGTRSVVNLESLEAKDNTMPWKLDDSCRKW